MKTPFRQSPLMVAAGLILATTLLDRNPAQAASHAGINPCPPDSICEYFDEPQVNGYYLDVYDSKQAANWFCADYKKFSGLVGWHEHSSVDNPRDRADFKGKFIKYANTGYCYESCRRFESIYCWKPNPRKERCDDYATKSVAGSKANKAMACGFSGGRYDSNWQIHKDWCMSLSGDQDKEETSARQKELKDCLNRMLGYP